MEKLQNELKKIKKIILFFNIIIILNVLGLIASFIEGNIFLIILNCISYCVSVGVSFSCLVVSIEIRDEIRKLNGFNNGIAKVYFQ